MREILRFGALLTSGLVDDVGDLAGQVRQLVVCDIPNDRRIDRVVAMDEDVPHPDDLSPRNIRVSLSELGGKTRARFADDLEMMTDEDADQLVCIEDLPALRYLLRHLVDGVEDCWRRSASVTV
jgi:hypothetical protein